MPLCYMIDATYERSVAHMLCQCVACMYRTCSAHMLSDVVLDSICARAQTMSSDEHLDGESARIVSRVRKCQNHQNLDFSRKVDFLAILALSGSGHDSGQIRCPEALSGQTLDLVPDPGSGQTSQTDPKPARKCLPGAIYRPLSIATLVENDWGRWGPFWRFPLTLALETMQF